ncbi:MAG: hypothetical protein WC915_04425 [archaeon]|jgi:hypothetical protein
MQALFFGLTLLGSCSLGYSLLRAGFPQKQSIKKIEKLAYSYALGILIFIPGMIVAALINEQFFFLITTIVYIILFSIFMAKRKYKNETDTVELIIQKTKVIIPNKILTKEEKEKIELDKTNDADSTQNYNQSQNTQTNYNSQDYSSNQNLNSANPKRRVSSDDVLKIVDPKTTKEQLFKDEETNVIEKLREKTINAKNNESTEKRKDMLDKLKGFAKQMEDDIDE